MIRTESRDGYSLITLDRPDKANALDADHCRQIAAAMTESSERGDRAAVITGTARVFSAGADFTGVGDDGFGEALYGMLGTLANAPMPIVGAINGHAIGAGLQLALCCDLRVVAPAATFAVPTARLGLAIDPWTTDRLCLTVGAAQARRMLMTCDRFGPDDPTVAGLVDRRGDLDAAVELAADLTTMAPLTLRYVKTAFNAGSGRVGDPAVERAYRLAWNSVDGRDGVRSRLEGRDPLFRGE